MLKCHGQITALAMALSGLFPQGTAAIWKDMGLSCHETEMPSCDMRGVQKNRAVARAFMRLIGVSLLALSLANCATGPDNTKTGNKYGVKASPKVIADGEPVPKGGGYDMVGKPYTVGGKLYVPKEVKGYSATGTASWYGPQFHGRLTANGEVFDRDSVSIAHPTMPLPSYVRVTNMLNGRSIIARANDRGPYHDDRLVDVSEQVATSLGFKHLGTARVRVDYLGRAPMEGDDDGMLLATLSDNWRPAQLGRAFPQKSQVASAAPFAPQPTSTEAKPPQSVATGKPLAIAPPVALPSHPPAAPAKGAAAKVLPGQKPAAARFATQVPSKQQAANKLAVSAKQTAVKMAAAKGAPSAKPTLTKLPAQLAKTFPAKARPEKAQTAKEPAKKAVVAQIQALKPTIAHVTAKPQSGASHAKSTIQVKSPDKSKQKPDPRKPQTA
jgi:rare lipoprotein A